MTNDEILEYLRENLVDTGEYVIQYNGKKLSTYNGAYESWTIIRKLSIFEELAKKITALEENKNER